MKRGAVNAGRLGNARHAARSYDISKCQTKIDFVPVIERMHQVFRGAVRIT